LLVTASCTLVTGFPQRTARLPSNLCPRPRAAVIRGGTSGGRKVGAWPILYGHGKGPCFRRSAPRKGALDLPWPAPFPVSARRVPPGTCHSFRSVVNTYFSKPHSGG
jgi:hypothetical protein